jgi:DNA-binding response OmpR family regulator
MKYRILYVEDEKILMQLVKDALEKQGYEVAQVSNGLDVVGAFKAATTHLCLLDIMLPGKDGYDVAAQIRALDPQVPIIFLTAKIQVGDVVAGFQSGCNDYIRKPFSMDELHVRISRWLTEKYGEHRSDESVAYAAGAYHFDPKKQLLNTPNGTIALTFKESTILNALFALSNQPISRNYLMQQVWGSETVYNSRSLDVYINRIRKYFGNSQNKILTLKGVGYKFITE